MKEIILTRGKIAQVDDADYDWLNQWKWHAVKDKYTFYAVRNRERNGKRGSFGMHRLILNVPDNIEMDHIDRNGLNNQRYNLRICTRSQNCMNRKSWGISNYIGVSPHCGKFQAHIRLNGKQIHLGTFKNKEDAAKIRDKAAIKYHREFANLNFR